MTLIETLLIVIYVQITTIIITINLLKLKKLENKHKELQNKNKELEQWKFIKEKQLEQYPQYR